MLTPVLTSRALDKAHGAPSLASSLNISAFKGSAQASSASPTLIGAIKIAP